MEQTAIPHHPRATIAFARHGKRWQEEPDERGCERRIAKLHRRSPRRTKKRIVVDGRHRLTQNFLYCSLRARSQDLVRASVKRRILTIRRSAALLTALGGGPLTKICGHSDARSEALASVHGHGGPGDDALSRRPRRRAPQGRLPPRPRSRGSASAVVQPRAVHLEKATDRRIVSLRAAGLCPVIKSRTAERRCDPECDGNCAGPRRVGKDASSSGRAQNAGSCGLRYWWGCGGLAGIGRCARGLRTGGGAS